MLFLKYLQDSLIYILVNIVNDNETEKNINEEQVSHYLISGKPKNMPII